MTGSTVISHRKKLLVGIILIAVAGGIGFLSYLRPTVVETDFFVPIETDIDALSITIMTPQSGGGKCPGQGHGRRHCPPISKTCAYSTR